MPQRAASKVECPQELRQAVDLAALYRNMAVFRFAINRTFRMHDNHPYHAFDSIEIGLIGGTIVIDARPNCPPRRS